MSSTATLINSVIGDGARNTKFDVAFQFSNPTAFPSPQNVAVMVKSASFPSKTHQTIDFKFKGRTIPIRGQSKYSNTWECTFYLPEDHCIKKGFESWIDALDEKIYFENTPNPIVDSTRSQHSKNGYVKDIAIYQLDFTGKNQVARYILHNVFPIEVQPVNVTNEGPGTIEELSVTFSYSHYEFESLKGASGNFVDGLVNKLSSELYNTGSNLLDSLGNELMSFLPPNANNILDVASNLPQTLIDNVNLSKASQEIEDLFDGINDSYSLPSFISFGDDK